MDARPKYQELIVWQKAMQLATEAYRVTNGFPPEERFGLTNQIRRASVSVPSNIAEGQGRLSRGEFMQFLGNARGSLFELETQLRLALELGLVTNEACQNVNATIGEVSRMLNGLIGSLRDANARP